MGLNMLAIQNFAFLVFCLPLHLSHAAQPPMFQYASRNLKEEFDYLSNGAGLRLNLTPSPTSSPSATVTAAPSADPTISMAPSTISMASKSVKGYIAFLVGAGVFALLF